MADKGDMAQKAHKVLIAPALAAADFASLGDWLGMVKAAGARMVHVDVADGHFVPELTVGQPVVKSLRRATDLTLDVHLLVEQPERFIGDFVEAGADRISIHAEATPHLHRALDLIRRPDRQGAKAGAALNPATPLEALGEVLGELDFVTILTADPGGAEEKFIPAAVEKVRAARRAREERRLDFDIEVEGGVGLENLDELVGAGADILVAGSAIFHKDDAKARLAEMIRLAAGVQQRV